MNSAPMKSVVSSRRKGSSGESRTDEHLHSSQRHISSTTHASVTNSA